MNSEHTVLFSEPAGSIFSELQPVLVDNGDNALSVTSLKETLLTLQDKKIDVLVLDASLLEEGCEFISVIRGINRDLQIIICSDTNTPEFESKIRQQRIFYYHIKSFGIQELEMAISNAINGLIR